MLINLLVWFKICRFFYIKLIFKLNIQIYIINIDLIDIYICFYYYSYHNVRSIKAYNYWIYLIIINILSLFKVLNHPASLILIYAAICMLFNLINPIIFNELRVLWYLYHHLNIIIFNQIIIFKNYYNPLFYNINTDDYFIKDFQNIRSYILYIIF